MKTPFVLKEEFDRIKKEITDPYLWLDALSLLSRINTLSMIKRAGSGHIGSSFSSMELFIWLYARELKITSDHHRDIFFSSKGHDAPGLYSVMYAFGLIPFEKILELRRLKGLDGHPDIRIPYVEANTGSLGMGISKAKGMAYAKKLLSSQGSVFVLTGDGELQEGQVWESLQTTAHQKLTNITVLIDHNKIQTDRSVSKIISLGDLEKKIADFGWYVLRCHGHSFRELEKNFQALHEIRHMPKVLILDTVKGYGVSFMSEGCGDGDVYEWHSGAPNDLLYEKAIEELTEKTITLFQSLELKPPSFQSYEINLRPKTPTEDHIGKSFGKTLLQLAANNEMIIVLDGDLAVDCSIREFETTFPARFIENGIAEQDMVSMAGGLARMGFLPVVNSFSSFLSSRANEQIYNNATEETKIIYACHYAGLFPAGPGKSHQSIRDISLFGSLPNCIIIEPCNAHEAKAAITFAVKDAKSNCMLRLQLGPSPNEISLPKNYSFRVGYGTVLNEGKDAIIFSYGPYLLSEALKLKDLLHPISLKVVNLPWLNRINSTWLKSTIGNIKFIYCLENHSPIGGLSDRLRETLIPSDKNFTVFAPSQFPACGTVDEVLKFHGLDAKTLHQIITTDLIR